MAKKDKTPPLRNLEMECVQLGRHVIMVINHQHALLTQAHVRGITATYRYSNSLYVLKPEISSGPELDLTTLFLRGVDPRLHLRSMVLNLETEENAAAYLGAIQSIFDQINALTLPPDPALAIENGEPVARAVPRTHRAYSTEAVVLSIQEEV